MSHPLPNHDDSQEQQDQAEYDEQSDQERSGHFIFPHSESLAYPRQLKASPESRQDTGFQGDLL